LIDLERGETNTWSSLFSPQKQIAHALLEHRPPSMMTSSPGSFNMARRGGATDSSGMGINRLAGLNYPSKII
jgi:hypothetical protein